MKLRASDAFHEIGHNPLNISCKFKLKNKHTVVKLAATTKIYDLSLFDMQLFYEKYQR